MIVGLLCCVVCCVAPLPLLKRALFKSDHIVPYLIILVHIVLFCFLTIFEFCQKKRHKSFEGIGIRIFKILFALFLRYHANA